MTVEEFKELTLEEQVKLINTCLSTFNAIEATSVMIKEYNLLKQKKGM